MSEMPWRGIAVRTAQGAAAIFVGLAALCAAELHRQEKAASSAARLRDRWTDKNRWEKP